MNCYIFFHGVRNVTLVDYDALLSTKVHWIICLLVPILLALIQGLVCFMSQVKLLQGEYGAFYFRPFIPFHIFCHENSIKMSLPKNR